jgi:hypothetical protein
MRDREKPAFFAAQNVAYGPNRTSTIQIYRAAQYYYIAKGLLDHLISGNKQRLRNR